VDRFVSVFMERGSFITMNSQDSTVTALTLSATLKGELRVGN
jgi:hypothetical protein